MYGSAEIVDTRFYRHNRYKLLVIFYFLDIGVGMGPSLLGFLAPGIGCRGMYGALAVMVALSGVFYHFLHGAQARNRE